MTTPLTLHEGLALAALVDARDGTRSPVIRRQRRVRVHGPAEWVVWTIPCLTCGVPTHARDRAGMPICQSCAEAELADRLTERSGR